MEMFKVDVRKQIENKTIDLCRPLIVGCRKHVETNCIISIKIRKNNDFPNPHIHWNVFVILLARNNYVIKIVDRKRTRESYQVVDGSFWYKRSYVPVFALMAKMRKKMVFVLTCCEDRIHYTQHLARYCTLYYRYADS